MAKHRPFRATLSSIWTLICYDVCDSAWHPHHFRRRHRHYGIWIGIVSSFWPTSFVYVPFGPPDVVPCHWSHWSTCCWPWTRRTCCCDLTARRTSWTIDDRSSTWLCIWLWSAPPGTAESQWIPSWMKATRTLDAGFTQPQARFWTGSASCVLNESVKGKAPRECYGNDTPKWSIAVLASEKRSLLQIHSNNFIQLQ